MIYMQLFFSFLLVGLFSIGGGYAAIPLIQAQVVQAHAWLSMAEFTNLVTIAEMTPGPIAINCATFTGYKKASFIGALIATLGMIVPSFAIIYLISMFLDNFLELTIIANAFKGIKIAVGILILDVAFTMIKKMHKKKLPRAIILCSAIVMLCINIFAWNFSSISLMLIAAVVSLTIFVLGGTPDQKGGAKK